MLFSPGIPDCASLFKQVKLFLIGHRVFLLRWSSSSIYYHEVDISPQAFVFISLGLRGTTLSLVRLRNTLHLLCINNTPLVDGDTAYIGAANGIVYALQANTGVLRWSYHTKVS